VLLGLSLNSSLRGHRRATGWIGCASLTLLVALFIGYPHLNDFDQGLSALVQEHRSAWLDETMVRLTQLGEFKNMFVASACSPACCYSHANGATRCLSASRWAWPQ